MTSPTPPASPTSADTIDFAKELYRAFEALDAGAELLSIIGSYKDTLSDSEVAALLQDYNNTGECLHVNRRN